MKRKVFIALLLLVIAALALAGCSGSGSKSTTQSQPASSSGLGNTVNSVEQQAGNAARESNLRIIDTAIQQYFVAHGSYPTDISQLSEYFARGVPTDPLGGTYYITTQNGVATAAVR